MDETVNTYLLADAHYYHDRCCIYSGRPLNFTDLINRNIRATIMPKDVIIYLGDVIFGKFDQLLEIIKSLPGKKILTIGNHDRRHSKTWFYRAGFDFVCNHITIDNFVLSHFPVKINNNQINIHGHFHNIPRKNWEPYLVEILTENHYLLSLEKMEYRPVQLSTIMKNKNLIRSINFPF